MRKITRLPADCSLDGPKREGGKTAGGVEALEGLDRERIMSDAKLHCNQTNDHSFNPGPGICTDWNQVTA